jgi:hypothetical protein
VVDEEISDIEAFVMMIKEQFTTIMNFFKNLIDKLVDGAS